MRMSIEVESWAYKTPFRVSRGAEVALDVLVVTLEDGAGHRGRGEAAGVDYDGETMATLRAQIESIRPMVEGADFDRGGVPRAQRAALAPEGELDRLGFAAQCDRLAALLPPGGARNALDCALWDFCAKRDGATVWQLADLPHPKPLVSCITFGIDSDAATAAAAEQYHDWPMIKVKVDGERHVEVIRLVHERCPSAALIVDPNQAWSCELLNRLVPELQALGVVLIEQPVPRDEDESLAAYRGAIRLAADESVADRRALTRIKDFYQVANIKLDKTGGLTEALATARAARALKMGVMVGCMAGTSLAMAPGMVVGQLASFVDLDGPLLHRADREHGIAYDRGTMHLFTSALWG